VQSDQFMSLLIVLMEYFNVFNNVMIHGGILVRRVYFTLSPFII
jgi:hypothetical protein